MSYFQQYHKYIIDIWLEEKLLAMESNKAYNLALLHINISSVVEF